MRKLRIVGLPVMVGVGAALVVYALMFPFECGGTDIGSPPGGPDMNNYSCDSILLHSPEPAGSLEGPTPGTDPDTKTDLDVLQTQMMLRGTAVAAVPVLLGLGVGWRLGTRRPAEDRELEMRRRLSAVAGPTYSVAVVAAIVGSVLGAGWLLNDLVAMVPLSIAVAAPLVALRVRSPGIWVVSAATTFQEWFATTAAVTVGFLILPSAGAMLVGAVADSLPHLIPSPRR